MHIQSQLILAFYQAQANSGFLQCLLNNTVSLDGHVQLPLFPVVFGLFLFVSADRAGGMVEAEALCPDILPSSHP